MHWTQSRQIFPLSIVLLATSSHADVIDVRGSNPDFDQIKDAVLAAHDGDVIRVWPGNYLGVGINDKALTLVVAFEEAAVKVKGTLRIRNLNVGKAVAVSGIDVDGIDGSALIITDCAGSVRISDATIEGGTEITGEFVPSYGQPGALISSSDDVVLNRCDIMAGPAGTNHEGGFGTHGLYSYADNRVSAFDCTFAASYSTYDAAPYGNTGPSAVVASGGSFYASGCRFQAVNGESGSVDSWGCGCSGDGGDGGDGFAGYFGATAWFLDCTFSPGTGGAAGGPLSSPGQDGVDFNVGIPLHGEARKLSSPALVDQSSPIQLEFTGTPGDQVGFRVRMSPGYSFSPILGPQLLRAQPRDPWALVGHIPATGSLLITLPVHLLPASDHQTLYFQGKVVGPERYFTSTTWTTRIGSSW